MNEERINKHNGGIFMKKLLSGIVTGVMVLSLGTVSVFAAGPGCKSNFTDTDGNGICDYADGVCAYADTDGDGICDSCGTGHGNCLTGHGLAFADADEDGICDNCGTYHWCGRNYVDADGDGNCDNYANGYDRGCGRHSSSHCGHGHSSHGRCGHSR